MRIFVLKLCILFILASSVFVSAQTGTTTTATPAKTTTKKKTSTKKKTKKTTKPATASTPTKTTATPAAKAPLNMPVMTFATKTKEFGNIKTGDKPNFTYEFTNTGDMPMDIDIVSGCDCTELDWTRKTVKPGEKGFVSAIFNSTKAEPEDHKKPLKKTIDIVLKQTHPKSGFVLVETLIFNVFITD